MTGDQAHDRVIDSRPRRHCYKCGREIGPDESICDVCNKAGMATPSATQYHATIVVAIVLGVALLAAAASFAMRGVGPYDGRVASFTAQGGQVVATVTVRNQGTRAGRAKCRLEAIDAGGRELGAVMSVSPSVAGGASLTYQATIPGVGPETARVGVTCQ